MKLTALPLLAARVLVGDSGGLVYKDSDTSIVKGYPLCAQPGFISSSARSAPHTYMESSYRNSTSLHKCIDACRLNGTETLGKTLGNLLTFQGNDGWGGCSSIAFGTVDGECLFYDRSVESTLLEYDTQSNITYYDNICPVW